MNEELKPCPFCGEKPATYSDVEGLWVYCNNGDCINDSSASLSGAWNARPDEDALRDELELARNERGEALDALDACLAHRESLNQENNALRARIAELEAAARPVAFSERMPENGQLIFTWDTEARSWYTWTFSPGGFQPEQDVYWLPMPPAPGGDA